MKRYKAINFEYDDAYGTGTALDIVEHPEGEWVKYDDIKNLLQNTSSNSDYAKCDGCKNDRNGHCLLSTNHCIRQAEDYFTKS